jgi:hypothetical protein
VPSAIAAADVAVALGRLQAAVLAGGDALVPGAPAQPEDEETAVSLRHCALPLIDLHKAATTTKCNVMRDSNQRPTAAH